MAFIEINKNPPRSQLASFGRLWTPIFAMVFSVMFWKAGLVSGCLVSLTLGMSIALVGWINPLRLKNIFVMLMIVTFPIGILVGFVLLRTFGKDPLVKVLDRNAESYWIERGEPSPVSQYFKQF
jgi:hypothetical protein